MSRAVWIVSTCLLSTLACSSADTAPTGEPITVPDASAGDTGSPMDRDSGKPDGRDPRPDGGPKPPAEAGPDTRAEGGRPEDGGRDARPDAKADTGSDPVFTDTVAMFHLNVQEYGYLADSALVVSSTIDLHERLGVRLDVYLTTWMVDEYETKHPSLLNRILTSPNVSVSYHVRPPKPYRANWVDRSGHDWAGLWNMSADEQYAAIKAYEEKGIDLTTGLSTSAEGGFVKLTRLYGRTPYVVGNEAENYIQVSSDKVFKDLGVNFVVAHGRASFEGDSRNGISVKPEAVDVKAFNVDTSLDGDLCVGLGSGGEMYDCEVAKCAGSAKKPCVVAFKMHDNDFFAEDSWWLTVYSKRPTPPWDPTQKAVKLTDAAQKAMWTRYEQIVTRAAANQAVIGIVGAKDWAKRMGK